MSSDSGPTPSPLIDVYYGTLYGVYVDEYVVARGLRCRYATDRTRIRNTNSRDVKPYDTRAYVVFLYVWVAVRITVRLFW